MRGEHVELVLRVEPIVLSVEVRHCQADGQHVLVQPALGGGAVVLVIVEAQVAEHQAADYMIFLEEPDDQIR